jgi:hypothetical protein
MIYFKSNHSHVNKQLLKSTISGEATKVNPAFNSLGPENIELYMWTGLVGKP